MTIGNSDTVNSSHATLTIMIDSHPTYCFYFDTTPEATVDDLMEQLQIYYYDCISQKGLYSDEKCQNKVSSGECVRKEMKLYLDLSAE